MLERLLKRPLLWLLPLTGSILVSPMAQGVELATGQTSYLNPSKDKTTHPVKIFEVDPGLPSLNLEVRPWTDNNGGPDSLGLRQDGKPKYFPKMAGETPKKSAGKGKGPGHHKNKIKSAAEIAAENEQKRIRTLGSTERSVEFDTIKKNHIFLTILPIKIETGKTYKQHWGGFGGKEIGFTISKEIVEGVKKELTGKVSPGVTFTSEIDQNGSHKILVHGPKTTESPLGPTLGWFLVVTDDNNKITDFNPYHEDVNPWNLNLPKVPGAPNNQPPGVQPAALPPDAPDSVQDYLDHPEKYTAPVGTQFRDDHNLIWTKIKTKRNNDSDTSYLWRTQFNDRDETTGQRLTHYVYRYGRRNPLDWGFWRISQFGDPEPTKESIFAEHPNFGHIYKGDEAPNIKEIVTWGPGQ